MRTLRVSEFLASRTAFVVLIPTIIVAVGLIRRGFPFFAENVPNLSKSDVSSADAPAVRVAIHTLAIAEEGAYLDVMQADATGVRRDAVTGRQLHAIRIPRGQSRWVACTGGDGTWVGVNEQNELAVVRDNKQLWLGTLPEQKPDELLTPGSLQRPWRQLAGLVCVPPSRMPGMLQMKKRIRKRQIADPLSDLTMPMGENETPGVDCDDLLSRSGWTRQRRRRIRV